MEEYWKGGVAALISAKEPLNLTENNKDKTSAKIRQKHSVQSHSESDNVEKGKRKLSSNCDNGISNENDIRKKKKNKLSSDNSEVSSEVVKDLPHKRRKRVADESQELESHSENIVFDNSDDVRKDRVVQNPESGECEDGDNTNDSKDVGENSTDSHNKKSSKKKKDIADRGVDNNCRTIFVGNLPLSFDHKKVVKLFKKFGEVESARIRCVPVANETVKKKVSAITKKFHPNRNSAVAYVVFKTEDSVGKAIAQNGMIVSGHHLRIDSAVSQKRDSNKSVFVGGLPFDIKDDELWDFFKDCGEIEDVRVVRDEKVAMGKGFGYVNFKSSASVELALKLNGEEINKRKINVQRCVQKKKKGKPPASSGYDKKRKRQLEKWQGERPKKKLKQTTESFDFQGKKAEQKSKKKKKGRTKDALRKNQIKSAFFPSSDKVKSKKMKGAKKS